LPNPKANLVSWSPLPCIAGGQTGYVGGSHAASCNDPRLGSAIAFPWHEYVPTAGYGGIPTGLVAPLTYYQVSVGSNNYCNTIGAVCALEMQDPQGVGPPQHWFVQGGSTNPFHFQFGS